MSFLLTVFAAVSAHPFRLKAAAIIFPATPAALPQQISPAEQERRSRPPFAVFAEQIPRPESLGRAGLLE